MPSNLVTILATQSSVNFGPVALDWMAGGPVSVRLTSVLGSSLAVASGHIEYTLDDILTTPSTAVTWSVLSSLGTLNSTTLGVWGASNFISSGAPSGVQSGGVAIQSPVAGLRFSCTSFTTIGFQFQVLQGRGW